MTTLRDEITALADKCILEWRHLWYTDKYTKELAHQVIADILLPWAEAKQAEIDALKQPMACGHQKACLVEFVYTGTAMEYDSAGYPVPVPVPEKVAHCTACQQIETLKHAIEGHRLE